MFKEHDMIALTEPIPFDALFDVNADALRNNGYQDAGLIPGDVGTIVHIYPRGAAFIVEFLTSGGDMVAIADVSPSQARRATQKDLKTARFRKSHRKAVHVKAKASTTTKAKNIVRERA